MAYDSTLIVYTGITTTNIPITAGQNLQTILQNIDGKLGSIVAPNYTSYDLACITQIDGSSHPTNTQNFAEGISKIVCDHIDDYDTFVGTTYVGDQDVITEAINGINNPELIYAPFSITDADSLTAVFGKMFTGFTGYNTALNPSAAGWSTLGLSSPTTVTNGFAALITYIDGVDDDVAAKEDAIGTFDNSANCLDGTAEDTAGETIDLLTTYVCNLPVFDNETITTTCMSAQDNLQDWVQELVSTVDGILGDYVARVSTGILLTAGSGCNGASIAIDPTYIGLRKVGIDSADSTYGYLEDKIMAGDYITLTQESDGGITKIKITNSAPEIGKVRVSVADSNPDYLINKFGTSLGEWGMSMTIAPENTGGQITLIPEVVDAQKFASNLLDTIGSDATLIYKFKIIMDSTAGDSPVAAAATGLTVTIR